MRALLARLRDSCRRRKIDRSFDDEMMFHLQELEDKHRAAGLSASEARTAAQRDFGNLVQVRENLRESAGFPLWDELVNDFRFALRGIARRRWLAVSVILILTLGLAAAATIYGLVDAVFLRPLPVAHPEELFAAVNSDADRPDRLSRGTVRRLEESLPGHLVAAYSGGSRGAVQIGSSAAAWAGLRLVNGNFFTMLGIDARVGRLLTGADDVTGAPLVAVASDPWARKMFGTAEVAVGREISINQTPVTIVGVLPPSFHDIVVGQATEVWLPTAAQPRLHVYGNSSESVGDDRPNDPDWNREERISWLQILIRIRPEVTSVPAALERAWAVERDDLIKANDDTEEQTRLKHRSWLLAPSPGGRSRLRGTFRSTGWLLGTVAGIMLALVCTNVSGLLLVRSMSRHREIGVRLALGAGSVRVMRLGFIEALILSIVGGAAGWLLATWLLPAAAHLLLPGDTVAVTLGVRSVVLMLAVALGCAVFSALAPALWVSRVEPLRALSGSRGLGRAPIRLGRILVVTQFAIAVALVALATALGAELQKVLAADPGFDPEHVVTAIFDPSSAGYETKAIPALLDRLEQTVTSVPQVQSVSFSLTGILAGSQWSSGVFVRDPQAVVHRSVVQHDAVLPGYFGVIGTPILLGREFTKDDRAGSMPVAIVNAAFAREYFGNRSPIGQSFGDDPKPSKDDRVIVGVVADSHPNGVRAPVPALYFAPVAQSNDVIPQFIAVRFHGPTEAMLGELRNVLARAEPGLVFTSWKTLQERMSDDLRGDRATSRLAAIFGACAIFLAGAGVAGSMGYLVILRQRELALRIAIGAEPAGLFRGVVADSIRLGIAGSLIGLVVIAVMPRIPAVKDALAVQPGLLSALVAAVTALVVAAIAGTIPGRRAARIDPIQILKAE
ncbi:MAG TPA: ABC transporter permease [Candidatus Didemnitutus sp.]|nr:ABC transporter permease [Candidatus Didemnitutus sp.]